MAHNVRTYIPCLPTRAMKDPSGEQWVHEVKHDGYLLMARKVDGRVPLYTNSLPRRHRLRVTSVVLDGEAMCFTDGMHDFDKLWNNCFDETVRLCAFYLLELNGEDYRGKPLAERKKRLARLLARPRDGIEYVEHLEGDGSRIFEHACKLGLSAATIKRMLRSTHLPEPARRVIQEYIEQKCAGESGTVSQE
jgi:bifunctional non-homologous end joining protein LigD